MQRIGTALQCVEKVSRTMSEDCKAIQTWGCQYLARIRLILLSSTYQKYTAIRKTLQCFETPPSLGHGCFWSESCLASTLIVLCWIQPDHARSLQNKITHWFLFAAWLERPSLGVCFWKECHRQVFVAFHKNAGLSIKTYLNIQRNNLSQRMKRSLKRFVQLILWGSYSKSACDKLKTDKMLLTQPRLDIEPWIHRPTFACVYSRSQDATPHQSRNWWNWHGVLHATLAPKAGASNFPVVGRAK